MCDVFVAVLPAAVQQLQTCVQTLSSLLSTQQVQPMENKRPAAVWGAVLLFNHEFVICTYHELLNSRITEFVICTYHELEFMICTYHEIQFVICTYHEFRCAVLLFNHEFLICTYHEFELVLITSLWLVFFVYVCLSMFTYLLLYIHCSVALVGIYNRICTCFVSF